MELVHTIKNFFWRKNDRDFFHKLVIPFLNLAAIFKVMLFPVLSVGKEEVERSVFRGSFSCACPN